MNPNLRSFFGINLEENISRELLSSTRLSVDSFTFTKNTISSINLEHILTEQNIVRWLRILNISSHPIKYKQMLLDNILEFSVHLFNDLKCELNTNHIVAKVVKPFIKNSFILELEDIDTANIDTALDRKEIVKDLKQSLNINSKINTIQFLQKNSGMTDDEYCAKKQLENTTERTKHMSTENCMTLKYQILHASREHIKQIIITRYSLGINLTNTDKKDDKFYKIVENEKNKRVFKLIQKSIFVNETGLIKSLKKASLNYVEKISYSLSPRYLILEHLVIYYFEMMYVLERHKVYLKSLSMIMETVDDIEESETIFFRNSSLPITKEIYSLYATLNKNYAGTKNNDVLSLLAHIASDELESDYRKISNLLRTIFYGSIDGGKHIIDKDDIEIIDDIYEITWRNYMDNLRYI